MVNLNLYLRYGSIGTFEENSCSSNKNHISDPTNTHFLSKQKRVQEFSTEEGLRKLFKLISHGFQSP